MKYLIILAIACALATSAAASDKDDKANCPGNSCNGGGSPGAGGAASATGGEASAGVNATVATSSRADMRTTTIQEQIIVTESNAEGIKAAGREHAETAADVRSFSGDGTTPCGDSSGLSGQAGVAGGGLATITESCRAYRLQRLQVDAPDDMSTKLAAITHFAGWFPRLLLHVASCGVLN